MKVTFLIFTLVLPMAACTHQSDGDRGLRARIVGTWTTADYRLPDQSIMSNKVSVFRSDGSWTIHYAIIRNGTSERHVTCGTWRIESGLMFEVITNFDGGSAEHRNDYRIIKLDTHEMILSNSFAPRSILVRRD